MSGRRKLAQPLVASVEDLTAFGYTVLTKEQAEAWAAAERELEQLEEALDSLRAAWNAHMARCKDTGPTITWEQMEEWRNAPSNTASGGGSDG